jgi:plasmid maintenance system antidote protein VapI
MAKTKQPDIKMSPEELRQLMVDEGLSHRELGDIIDVKQPNITAMVNGKRTISAKMTKRIQDGIAWYNAQPEPGEREAWLQQMRDILERGEHRETQTEVAPAAGEEE